MMRYLTVLALSLAGVAVWLTPTPAPERELADERPPETLQQVLYGVTQEERELLVKESLMDIHDELASEVVAAHRAGDGPLIRPTPDADEQNVARLRASIEANDVGADVAIGAIRIVSPDRPGATFTGGIAETEFQAGMLDGTPYCLAFNVIEKRHLVGSRQWPGENPEGRAGALRELGPCAFVQRYGLPGRQLTRWINFEGVHFMGDLRPIDWEVVTDAWNGRNNDVRRAERRISYLNDVGRACMAGALDLCEVDFTEIKSTPWTQRRSGVSPLATTTATYSAGSFVLGSYLRPSLVAQIEEAFGAKAFGEFWTSDAQVPEAFEAAFGIPMGQWLHDYASQYYPAFTSGPAPRGADWLLSLLLTALFAFLALRRQLGRRTG